MLLLQCVQLACLTNQCQNLQINMLLKSRQAGIGKARAQKYLTVFNCTDVIAAGIFLILFLTIL